MSAKNLDRHNRFRSRTVAFRVSPEEAERLDMLVALSGLTKQDYITDRLLGREVVVVPSMRLYKKVREVTAALLARLEEVACVGDVPPEIVEVMQALAEEQRALAGAGSPETAVSEPAPSAPVAHVERRAFLPEARVRRPSGLYGGGTDEG